MFSVKDDLKLIFSLPGDEGSIFCDARVAWVNTEDDPTKPNLPVGVGVEFINVTLKDIVKIAKFIDDSYVEGSW